jgi:hypothetical protein
VTVSALTSTCAVVTATTGKLTDPTDGVVLLTLKGGWRLRCTSAGVTISKASSFGGTQAAPTFPISLADARELVDGLRIVTT